MTLSAFISVPELMLRVRFPTEVHDVREFIQPNQFHVRHALLDVKDKYGELNAYNCWDWVCSEVIYPRDERGTPNEYHRMDSYAIRQRFVVGAGWVTDPAKRQQVWWEWFDFPWEILAGSPKIADCISADTEIICVIDNHYEAIPISKLEGMKNVKVPSYNFETQAIEIKPVTAVIPKGRKGVYEIQLRNGTSFECTANHRLFRTPTTYNREGVEECVASDLDTSQHGNNSRHQLVTLRKLPSLNGKSPVSPDELWVYGHYAAEGYSRRASPNTYAVSIAGDNLQLRQLLAWKLLRLGVPFSFSKRSRHASMYIGSSPLRDKLSTLGHNAFEKKFPDFVTGLGSDDIEALLDGYILGDTWLPKKDKVYCLSKKNTVLMHTTSSDKLAQQLRLLHFILGRPLYNQYQLHHGGSGHQPIWRLYENKNPVFNRPLRSTEGGMYPDLSKVGVSRIVSKGEQETFDITVKDNHNFFLAKSGVLVHNCDGKAILLCNMLRTLGEPARVALGGFSTDKEALSHAWVLSNGMVLETTVDQAGLTYPEENERYVPLIYFDETVVTLDPSVYTALKDLDYIPALGDMYRGLGISMNCQKKASVLCEMLNGSLSCEFV